MFGLKNTENEAAPEFTPVQESAPAASVAPETPTPKRKPGRQAKATGPDKARKTDQERLTELEAKIEDLQGRASALRARIKEKSEKARAAKIARVAKLLESKAGEDLLELDESEILKRLGAE